MKLLSRLKLAGAVASMISLAGAAQAQTPPPVFQNWLNTLTAAGYGVTQGSAAVTSIAYCEQVIVPLFGTCFNNDPGDPYVVPLMPVGAGYVDPYFGLFAAQTLPNGTVVGQSFRLAPTEAELVIVTLPPLGGYFSYQNYAFTRPTADYTHSVQLISPDPARAVLYASYGNSINNTAIQQQSGLGFGQGTVAFISTPNGALSAAMTSQFAAVGGDTRQLFTDAIGNNVHLGLDVAADDFSGLLRFLVPQSSSAGLGWLNNAASNVLVYRIAQPAGLATTAYAEQSLLPRRYNLDERVYSSSLSELNRLMKGWLSKQESKNKLKVKKSSPTQTVNSAGVATAGSVGPLCITHGNLCNGDEQDAIHWAVAVGKVPDGQLFVVDGVNTAATNNTTVFSLAVEDATINTGVGTINQTNPAAAGFASGNVTGSAQNALMTLGLWSQASPTLQQNAPYLFVQIFTRGCVATQPYCNQPFTSVVTDQMVPPSDVISIFLRAYALPGYSGGPNPYYLLAPYAIY